MADISTTEEEKEELRKEMNDPTVATSEPPKDDASPASTAEADTPAEAKAAEIKASASESAKPSSQPSSASAKPHPADGLKSDSTVGAHEPGATTPPTTGKSQKGDKLTEEQRAQLNKMSDERVKEREERISTLAKKLVDRCRAFENASKPGDADDIETRNFEKRLREEAEDMKAQSFGVELLHLIGAVYMSKASTYLKLHKGQLALID